MKKDKEYRFVDYDNDQEAFDSFLRWVDTMMKRVIAEMVYELSPLSKKKRKALVDYTLDAYLNVTPSINNKLQQIAEIDKMLVMLAMDRVRDLEDYV